MYKSILAAASVFAIAGSAILAAPAFADDNPAPANDPGVPTSTSVNDNTPDGSGGATVVSPDGQSYKADFSWSVPGNPDGSPYTTCDVSLFRANGELAFSAPYPADLPKLTLQFGSTELTGDPIIPGTTGLTIHYTCTNGTDTSAEQTLDSIAVPDVPPTQPTNVDVTAQGSDGLNVQYGGSQALGVAPLEGYNVSVQRDGANYANVVYGVDGKPVGFQTMVRGFSRMNASSLQGLAGNFDNLPSGIYTVKVAAFNSIGLSDAKAATTQVIVNAKGSASTRTAIPNNLRGLATAAKATSAKVSWKAPATDAKHALVSRYVVTVSLNGKTVVSKSVSAKTTSLNVSKLKANTRYQVRVDAYGLGAAQVHKISTFKTPKAAKAKVVKKAVAKKH